MISVPDSFSQRIDLPIELVTEIEIHTTYIFNKLVEFFVFQWLMINHEIAIYIIIDNTTTKGHRTPDHSWSFFYS